MASPVAHSLAGAIIHFASRRGDKGETRQLWWLILAANLADLDLIPSLLMGDHTLFHRTFSHSMVASLLFAAIVYAACRWREHRYPVRMTLLMLTAYLSQLALDWVSLDPGPIAGIPFFWPFSQEYYMADTPVFLNIERDDLFSPAVIIHNIKAVLLETVVLGPLAALMWWWNRQTTRS